ncbi:MAG: hypothetical protein PHH19_00435 [Eubacteriales bacterium]|jgi:Fe2+ transport system protein FeoA|nr:hypothetical protein [Eubacteriales bacterium]
MVEVINLNRLKEGVVAEIVEAEEALFHLLGITKGMSVIVLQKTVDWLIQVGYDQLLLKEDVVSKIKVKTVNI